MAAASAAEAVLFGDTTRAQWSHWSWGAAEKEITTTICTGSKAIAISPGQYRGMGFSADNTGAEINAKAIRLRVHVDKAATVSVAVAPLNPPNDIHQYFLSPESKWSWQPGWNEAEFEIPESFGKAGQLIFEQQSDAHPEFIVDDIRFVLR